FRISSSTGEALVTLHRPPPEMPNFLPNLSPLSTSRTFALFDAAAIEAIKPEGPPPIMITSYAIVRISFFKKRAFESNFIIINPHFTEFILEKLFHQKKLTFSDKFDIISRLIKIRMNKRNFSIKES